MQTGKKKGILNSQLKDSSSKIIFEDNILCSQFLRDYVDLPFFKNVKPEDIEDVSEHFVPLFAEEREADRVKRVTISSEIPFFLISLIEHKTKVEYNIHMQIFRYMVYIWESYERDMEKEHPGISRRKGFKYPPILPIVYYEGKGKWTAPAAFSERVLFGESFRKYLPDFTFYLCPLHELSNESLIEHGDEISLVMLINKIQSIEDIELFRKLPAEKLDRIIKNTPEYLLDIITKVLKAFLVRENVPVEETEELIGKVKDRKMGQLFENMDKMDIQAERRKTEAERKRTEAERRRTEAERKRTEAEREEKKEALEKGKKELIKVCRKLNASKEFAVKNLMEAYSLNREAAAKTVERYWND